jgi:glutaredoxin
VAYNKVEDGGYAPPLNARIVQPERRTAWPVWLGIALAIAAGAWYVLQHGAGSDRRATAQAHTGQPEVLMYATSWCGYCAKARAYFDEHRIDYVELDVERDEAASQQNRQLGGGGVPTIRVGEDIVHGFDEGALSRLLGPWAKN